MAESYLSQVGVVERTGNNDGLDVEKYLSYVGLPAGNPWCAAFVAWNLGEAGIDNPRSGWSPSYFTAGSTVYARGSAVNHVPRMGDVFGIYFSSLGRIAHVGFVHSWSGSWAVTVEGNTNDDGSREGNKVAIKRRPIKTIYKVSDWIDN